LTHGEWTPLAAWSDDLSVLGSRWRLGAEELWALANRRSQRFNGDVSLAGSPCRLELPPLALAAVTRDGVAVFGAGSTAYPARAVVRAPTPRAAAGGGPPGFP